ncbi:hypothetical protein EST38_g13587 [Candolleomyces aberdarensis]|uniref:Uncharacterized protein n=1 Tax=Candolleomyces aberdarensis TaxID=2316362 RepID=A0A4Q2CZK2_9AGAR|nr:hypothetical protein EST38_g13587 [Candolleomyces aberdarensis]
MQLYLLSRSLWQMVKGEDVKPSSLPASASSSEKEENKIRINAWMEKSDSAKGTMLLKVREDLRVDLMEKDAPTIWKHFADTLGQTTDSQIFSWFCEWYRFQIPGSQSPLKEFAHWDLLVSKLKAANMEIPDKILAMQLVANMPPAYSTILPLMVSEINGKTLTSAKVKGYMLTEWERKQKPAKKAAALRISAVQRKGQSPSFHQQQKGSKPSEASSSKQRADQPQQQQGEKKRQRKGRGQGPKSKSKGKGRAHVADADSDTMSDTHADNMFASLSLAERISTTTIATASSSQVAPSRPADLQHKSFGKMTPRRKSQYENNPFAVPFSVVPPVNSVEYDPAVAQAHYDAVQRPSTSSHFDFPPLSSPPRTIPGVTTPILQFGEIPPSKGFSIGLPNLRGGNSRTSDPRPKPKQKASIALINNSGLATRTVAENQPVQEKPTPKSIYPCVESSRKIAEELGVLKTTETMKTLERSVMASEELMAPIDNAAYAIEMEVDEDDVVSISSEPDRKRSRSLSPDQQAPNKKQRLESIEEDDLEELFTDPSPPSRDADGFLTVKGREWRVELNGAEIVHRWKERFWISGNLKFFWEKKDKGEYAGKAIRFNPDGNVEIVDEVEGIHHGGFISQEEYIIVEEEDGLYLHFGDMPRTKPRKGYSWFYMENSGIWIQKWNLWVGTLTYDEEAYQQDAAESSIMGGER